MRKPSGSAMYRPSLTPSERGATVTAVLLVHLALAYALLHLAGIARLRPDDPLTQLINLAPPPPQAVIEPPSQPRHKPAAASASNIASKATPVVAPIPAIELPRPSAITASPTPREGSQSTQGASAMAGPGTGAGGAGNGDGSGGAGEGGGGNGLAVVRTSLATPTLNGRDFPPDLLDEWPRGRQIYMRLRVDTEGRAVQCIVDIGSGDTIIDRAVCATAKARLRFRPGLDRDGQRVADWFGYGQRPL